MDKNETYMLLKMKLHLYNYPRAKVPLEEKYDDENTQGMTSKKSA